MTLVKRCGTKRYSTIFNLSVLRQGSFYVGSVQRRTATTHCPCKGTARAPPTATRAAESATCYPARAASQCCPANRSGGVRISQDVCKVMTSMRPMLWYSARAGVFPPSWSRILVVWGPVLKQNRCLCKKKYKRLLLQYF